MHHGVRELGFTRPFVVLIVLAASAVGVAQTPPPKVPSANPQDRSWFEARPGAATDRETGLPREVVHRRSGIELVLVPAGSFTMGAAAKDPHAERAETPAHRVTISRPFYIGRYEVTNAEFRRFRADHDSGAIEGRTLNDDRQPAGRITWDEAQAFCKEYGFDLPTEAQWEYAARAGVTTRFPWGADEAVEGKSANVYDKSGRRAFPKHPWPPFDFNDGFEVSSPVGRFAANAFGLHDMIGNVFEWCADPYERFAYRGREAGVADPGGPAEGETRILRGGSWRYGAEHARLSFRGRNVTTFRVDDYGFRVVRPLD